MKFRLDQNEITCLPESPSELSGVNDRRQPISLSTHTLYFSETPTKLPSPDHLALICMIVFYPYLKQSSSITFPQPVSPKIKEILQLHQLTTRINLHQPSTTTNSSIQSRIGLSWGGGLDSWAAYSLHPEKYTVIIHEAHLADTSIQFPSTPHRTIATNQRYISTIQSTQQSAGWTTWVGVLITSLWLSAEYQLTHLTLGGNLGSTFLNNGRKYYPTHLKPSLWYRTFQLVNLPIYLPLAGLTDLGVIRILGPNIEQLQYCWFPTAQGENCHRCAKCLRKELLLGRNPSTIPSTTLSKLSFDGPSYDYITTYDSTLKLWVDQYYTPALQLLPSNLDRSILINALKTRNIQMISQKNSHLVEHYGL
jgi:hypothetical protein